MIKKIIFMILIIVFIGLFAFLVISGIWSISKNEVFLSIFKLVAAVIPLFLSILLLPLYKSFLKIKKTGYDGNFNKNDFIDRELILDGITNAVKRLKKSKKSNIMWIRIFGESGIGKTELIHKIYHVYSKFHNFFKYSFKFIRDEDYINYLELVKKNYPLENNIIVNDSKYMKCLSEKRTFSFFIFENCNIYKTKAMIDFINQWISATKRKAVFISTYVEEVSSKNFSPDLLDYEMEGLNNKYIAQLIAKKNSKIGLMQKYKIIEKSKGNPAMITFICNHNFSTIKQQNFENFEDIIKYDLQFIEKDKKDFLMYLCCRQYLNNKYVIDCLRFIEDLEKLKQLACIKYLNKISEDKFVLPDWLCRMIIDIFPADLKLQMRKIYDAEENTITKKEIELLIDIEVKRDLKKELTELHKSQNYKQIIRLYELSQKYTLLNKYIKINANIKKIIIYFTLSAYLNLGQYQKAEKVIDEFPVEYGIRFIEAKDNDLFKINLLIADYYHLTNKFELSNNLLAELLNIKNIGDNYKNFLQFHIAHNLRHQGRLNESNALFDEIIKNAQVNSDIFIRACYSKFSNEMFFLSENPNYLNYLNELLNNCSNLSLKYNIKRHIGIYFKRILNDYNRACQYYENVINELETENFRILQDYYFELAEGYRLQGYYSKQNFYNLALQAYIKAIFFAQTNDDINLYSNSLLGKLILERKYKKKKEIKAELLKIIDITEKHDLFINNLNAKIVFSLYFNDKIKINSLKFLCKEKKYLHQSDILLTQNIDRLQLTTM